MAAGSAQATDGYAADGEAIATDDEASGHDHQPRGAGAVNEESRRVRQNASDRQHGRTERPRVRRCWRTCDECRKTSENVCDG